MKANERDKNPAAVALGALGGKAGRGKAKRRGEHDYYRRLALKRVRKAKSNNFPAQSMTRRGKMKGTK